MADRKANGSDTTDNTRKSARFSNLLEGTNQERLESELNSELDEVNMRNLERQLAAHRELTQSDGDFQPSLSVGSTAEEPARENRKRRQPYNDD